MIRLLPVLLLVACTQAPPAPAPPPVVGIVAAMPVAGHLPSTAAIGTLAGDPEVDLGFKLPGRIAAIGRPEPWRPGTTVMAGQVLATLDAAQLRQQVEAAAARARADAALFERGAKLAEQALISRQEFDLLTANRDASAAQLRLVESQLTDAELRAPFAGTVLARHVNPDETVAAGRPVLRLADLRRMVVELGVPEQMVSTLDVGRRLDISVGAFHGERWSGIITEVGAAAQPGTRLFRVKLGIDNPDGRLRPGMSATVRIPGTPPPADAVIVPLSALRGDATATAFTVFVVHDGLARSHPVQVVDVIGSGAVVLGLPAQTPVVARGAGLCAEGLRVDARP